MLAFTACARSSAPLVAASGGDEARTSAPAPDGEPINACTEPGLSLELPATIALVWNGSTRTGGAGEIIVRWCGPGPATLRSVEVGERESGQTIHEFDETEGRLEPGRTLTRRVWGSVTLGPTRVLARAQRPSGELVEAEGSFEIVDDPARVAAIAECDACGGQFRSFGMLARELCDCPTSDAGTRCLASSDCEGPCIFARDEVLPAGASAPDGRTCAAPQELRLRVGRCHDRQRRFGCHARLDHAHTYCSAPGLGGRVPNVCVD
jgi:hypothetical protein